jgi:hypothetical protein
MTADKGARGNTRSDIPAVGRSTRAGIWLTYFVSLSPYCPVSPSFFWVLVRLGVFIGKVALLLKIEAHIPPFTSIDDCFASKYDHGDNLIWSGTYVLGSLGR